MYQGKTLEELAREIQRQATAKSDYIADTRRMRFAFDDSNVSLDLSSAGIFDINNYAHRQVATHTKIPAKYYDRMVHESPELLCQNVNHWFNARPDDRLVRTLDGTFRAFMSKSYRMIDNEDVAEFALPILHDIPDMQVISCDVTEKRMYIKALFPRLETELKLNDPVQAGVVIANSEIGQGSVVVEPLVYRLVCLNGLILPSRLKRRHVGRAMTDGNSIDVQTIYRDDTKKAADAAFLLKLRDTIASAADEAQFNKHVEQMRATTEMRITTPDPVKVVDRTKERFGLNDTERGSVLTHLIQGGDLTGYGLLNAITRASQDSGSYDRATELERIGGEILELSPNEWHVLAEAA